jgi:hypothetical protein
VEIFSKDTRNKFDKGIIGTSPTKISNARPEKSTKHENDASLIMVIGEKQASFMQHRHFEQNIYHWVDD